MERLIRLDGALNFRDLGGYPTGDGRCVRWRRVFRSDALHGLSAADVGRVCAELRVCDVIDLRSSAELHTDGRGLLADKAVRFHHVPLYDGEQTRREPEMIPVTLADRYVLLAEYGAAAIARVVAIVAGTDGAAVFHCAAGKDRTGIVSAVILGVLGVPDEIIAADYAATQENLTAIIERLLAAEGYRTVLEALPADTLHAKPGTMRELLRQLRARHGSLHGYLRSAGLAEEAFERLERGLLEEGR